MPPFSVRAVSEADADLLCAGGRGERGVSATPTCHPQSSRGRLLLGPRSLRQEDDRITGLYNFTDHFKHQNSVMFSGTLNGQSARINVAAVRTDGSPNFTAEMTGSRASMTGPMMSGTSRQPVRACTLVLSAA